MARDVLKRALDTTAECIPLERLGEELTPQERQHLARCPRCQGELALWEEMSAGAPDAGDGAAVQWIVAEVRRRRAAAREEPASSLWGWFRLRGLAAAAATLVVGVVVGYVAWDREPGVREPVNTSLEYRATQLLVIAPVGDVAVAPTELVWKANERATRYDVSLLEVDRTPLWTASTTVSRVVLPADVRARLVPGKTVTWEVTARDASGSVVAESGTQRFRVAVGSPNQGE